MIRESCIMNHIRTASSLSQNNDSRILNLKDIRKPLNRIPIKLKILTTDIKHRRLLITYTPKNGPIQLDLNSNEAQNIVGTRNHRTKTLFPVEIPYSSVNDGRLDLWVGTPADTS